MLMLMLMLLLTSSWFIFIVDSYVASNVATHNYNTWPFPNKSPGFLFPRLPSLGKNLEQGPCYALD